MIKVNNMAKELKSNLTEKLLGKEGKDWESLADFRKRHGGIKSQALQYAMKNELVDYIKIGPKASAIILTENTRSYTPKFSPSREG